MGGGQRREPRRRWGAEAPTIHPHLRRVSLDVVAADRPYSSDASVGASPLPRSRSETLTQRPAREKQRVEEERIPWRKACDGSR